MVRMVAASGGMSTVNKHGDGDERGARDDRGLPAVVQSALERLTAPGKRASRRAGGLYAMYRLMRAFGLSDAEIARRLAERAGGRLDESLERVQPADARPAFDALADTLVRAAEDVDTRLDMHGDLVRHVREGAVAARAGREETIAALERGLQQGREGLRRALKTS